MRLLVDMKLSPSWVAFLLSNDLEADHWSDVGNPTASDEEIMRYAFERDMIVMTNDLDFSAILESGGGTKPSVVQLRTFDLRPSKIGEHAVAAMRQVEDQLAKGAVLTIDMSSVRLRLLPLAPPV